MKKRLIPSFLLIFAMALAMGACQDKNPVIEIETPKGKILVELYPDKAPVTAGNFLDLVKKGVYDGGDFYRTVRGVDENNPVVIQVLQGGVANKELSDKVSPIAHETTEQTGIKHLDGVISMARSKPGTAATEFFICVNAQPELDLRGRRNPDGQGFAAFGRVLEGMEVVRAIWSGNADGQRLVPPQRIHKIVVK